MTERKQEKNSAKVQVSFRVDELLRNRFASKVKGLGLDIQEVFTHYMAKFVDGREGDDNAADETALPRAPKSSRQVLEMMAWLLGPDGPTDRASEDWKASLRWSAKRWAEERKKPE